jgi:hypothetical protein
MKKKKNKNESKRAAAAAAVLFKKEKEKERERERERNGEKANCKYCLLLLLNPGISIRKSHLSVEHTCWMDK